MGGRRINRSYLAPMKADLLLITLPLMTISHCVLEAMNVVVFGSDGWKNSQELHFGFQLQKSPLSACRSWTGIREGKSYSLFSQQLAVLNRWSASFFFNVSWSFHSIHLHLWTQWGAREARRSEKQAFPFPDLCSVRWNMNFWQITN